MGLLDPKAFCYWLQGMLEGNPDMTVLTPKQLKIVREHLELVFDKMSIPAPVLTQSDPVVDHEKLAKEIDRITKLFPIVEYPTTVIC